jgi:hypothetical protein
VDDPAVVAAIAAGELDGLATAMDRYAAALYDYCYALAPAAAAEAVGDTFVIAWSSIDRLRDPAKLYPWLQAVAGNECFRRALVGGPADGQAGPIHPAPEPTLPPDLPRQVLSACADNTSIRRAYRVSVTYRAGPFGRDGFPKADSRPRARRLRLAVSLPGTLRRRRPPVGTVAGLAVLAAVVAAASMVVAGLPSGGPRHEHLAGDAAPASGMAPGSGGEPALGLYLPTTPTSRLQPSRSGRFSPDAQAAGGAPSPSSGLAGGTAGAGRTARTSAMAKKPSPTGTRTNSPVAPTTTVTPKPTATATAVTGVLSVDQVQLNFVLINGGESIRTFVITAEGGPVPHYTIAVPAGLPGTVTVSPSSGSLGSGDSATITVTASGTAAFTTSLTVNPGGTVIAVDVKVSPQPGKTKPPA